MIGEDQLPDPNGLCFSPDYKKLYVISTGRGPGDAHQGGKRDMHVFDVGSDNKLSNQKVFSDFMVDGIKCGPDGARCDVDGNVWVSSNGNPGGRGLGYSGVTVWTPEGKLIGRIRLPEVCGNLCFGGPKRNRLFMCGKPVALRPLRRHAGRRAGLSPTVLDTTPPELVTVAAAAGFRTIGIRLTATPSVGVPPYDILRDGPMLRETLPRLADTGVSVLDTEFLRFEPENPVGVPEGFLEVSARLGAQNVLVMSAEPEEARTLERFGELCDRAAPYGLRVGLEFAIYTGVRTLAHAAQVVARSERPNASVVIDALHFSRSGGLPAHIAQVDPALLRYAQICDASPGHARARRYARAHPRGAHGPAPARRGRLAAGGAGGGLSDRAPGRGGAVPRDRRAARARARAARVPRDDRPPGAWRTAARPSRLEVVAQHLVRAVEPAQLGVDELVELAGQRGDGHRLVHAARRSPPPRSGP